MKCHLHASRGTMRDTCFFNDGWCFSLALRIHSFDCSRKIRWRAEDNEKTFICIWHGSYLSLHVYSNIVKRFRITREGICSGMRKGNDESSWETLPFRGSLRWENWIESKAIAIRYRNLKVVHWNSNSPTSLDPLTKFPSMRAGASRFSPFAPSFFDSSGIPYIGSHNEVA